jgi:mannose-6-phosphate isomerase-like protein (cupin superfamily)
VSIHSSPNKDKHMNPAILSQDINDYITRSGQMAWQPLVENGIAYPGIEVISLRYDAPTRRSPSILLKLEPGARYPYHNHPAGEELYVLSGEVIVEDVVLTQGDYLYTPPGFRHSVRTHTGCVLLFIVPQEVEKLEEGPGEPAGTTN